MLGASCSNFYRAEEFVLNEEAFVNSMLIQVKCYDWDSDGSSDFIGEFTTTARRFQEAGSRQVRTRDVRVTHSCKSGDFCPESVGI